MAKRKKTDETDEVSFEQSFEELQDIVTKMEAGDLSLGDSLACYETGIKRLKECYLALNQAEQKIRQLADLDKDGNLKTSSFSTKAANGNARSKRKPTENDELF